MEKFSGEIFPIFHLLTFVEAFAKIPLHKIWVGWVAQLVRALVS